MYTFVLRGVIRRSVVSIRGSRSVVFPFLPRSPYSKVLSTGTPGSTCPKKGGGGARNAIVVGMAQLTSQVVPKDGFD